MLKKIIVIADNEVVYSQLTLAWYNKGGKTISLYTLTHVL